jgi:hypothetical protein
MSFDQGQRTIVFVAGLFHILIDEIDNTVD